MFINNIVTLASASGGVLIEWQQNHKNQLFICRDPTLSYPPLKEQSPGWLVVLDFLMESRNSHGKGTPDLDVDNVSIHLRQLGVCRFVADKIMRSQLMQADD